MQATHQLCTPFNNSPHHQTWPEDRARAMQLNPSKSRHSETNPVPQHHPNRYRTMWAHSACPGPSGNPKQQAERTPKVSRPQSGVKTGTRVTRVRINGILVVLQIVLQGESSRGPCSTVQQSEAASLDFPPFPLVFLSCFLFYFTFSFPNCITPDCQPLEELLSEIRAKSHLQRCEPVAEGIPIRKEQHAPADQRCVTLGLTEWCLFMHIAVAWCINQYAMQNREAANC